MPAYPRNQARNKPIVTAPKDGQTIYVLNPDENNKLYPVKWDPDGDSVVGTTLVNTGFWVCLDGNGWFEPDEVTHWLSEQEVYITR